MDRIRVTMTPHPDEVKEKPHSGIAQVVLNWARHLPDYGIDVVAPNEQSDLSVGHVISNVGADIHVSHGLLWTEEMKNLGQYAYDVNAELVRAATYAREIIAPSEWVADVYRRDMHRKVHVIPHGVNVGEWEHDKPLGEYVLYTKNRTRDGLDPSQIDAVARELPYITFYTTFATKDSPPNVITYGGTVPHDEMKRHIQEAGVVFMPDRETWGIAAAEALAAGVPVCTTSIGAVKTFVEHGLTGYVYKHKVLADAVQGLKYCLKNGSVLSHNARVRAEETLRWEDSVQAVADVIQGTYHDIVSERKLYQIGQVDTVAAVITSHNYGHLVGRAIESVLNQSLPVKEVIVVDDSSDDDTREVVEGFATRDDVSGGERVKYLRVDVENVADARNAGWKATDCKYVLMLDGDDWIRRDFISACIDPLMADKKVGFSYSGTEVVIEETGEVLMPPGLAKASGKRAHKAWPTMDYDKQFTVGRANQFPSCCLFRREALKSTGGYRTRYAPRGAGTEDAQLFLRLLAIGYVGKMVKPTMENLWVHYHGFGHVSGAEDFTEVDWRAAQPYTKDFRFPFAAAATPKNVSHPVRSYEPEVSVIIPVGPGHEKILVNALDSLESQMNRAWEAVVVWDCELGSGVKEYYEDAYPYVRWLNTFSEGRGAGPGAARNEGVEAARSDYITFLDADDVYGPKFLSLVNPDTSKKTNAVVYSEYYSRMEKNMLPKLQGDVIKEEGDNVVVSYNFNPYDRSKAMTRPDGKRPYVWTGVNVLLPRAWHEEIGGFDESMRTWEDCLYLLKLAWHGHSFHLVEHPLWVYSFLDGGRRDKSSGKEVELMEYIQSEYDLVVEQVPV